MAVLLLASVIDWDLVVHLYITPQYNVLFFITVFTAILAVSRGLVPDEQQTFEPEVLLQGVVERMNRAQIEVADLQTQRDEAQRMTKKLQKEINGETEGLRK